jgi:hypothetical protein
MEHAEKDLQESVVEDTAKETITERNGTEAISMSEAETLSGDLDKSRLLKLLHAQFLEIRIRPHIVVSLEEKHLHSPVHQIGQSRKHPHISFRNHITILVPEVPDIAEKVHRLRILRQRAEKTGKTTFTVGRICDLKPQMYI